ncbi:MAG: TIGR01777 family protein [Planctomycetota bacterium]|nr:MAG: TIGR01777 family protein [Planctomycetota bacterium]
MNALVTGGTGFIGRKLLARLERPAVLSRDAVRAEKELAAYSARAFAWSPLASPPPMEAFAGVDTVFNLAGEPVGDRRWNAAKKQAIRESRVLGTRNLVDAVAKLDARPRVLVSASAVGYYGDRGDELLDESSSPADDFLAQVCVEWEREAARAEALGVRVVQVRTGVVLGKEGGALPKMLFPFKLGLGGRLGSGKQWMPWIHINDVVGIMLHAATNDQVRGPINAVAPSSATNAEFTKALGKALGRPTIFPMPAAIFELLVGEFAQIVLSSQKIAPRVARDTGYRFQHPEIHEALRDIVAR